MLKICWRSLRELRNLHNFCLFWDVIENLIILSHKSTELALFTKQGFNYYFEGSCSHHPNGDVPRSLHPACDLYLGTTPMCCSVVVPQNNFSRGAKKHQFVRQRMQLCSTALQCCNSLLLHLEFLYSHSYRCTSITVFKLALIHLTLWWGIVGR